TAGPPRLGGGRRAAVGASLLGGTAVFLAVAHHHYPIQSWLLWPYLRFAAVAILLVAACGSVGHLALVRGLRMSPPLRERFFMSFALGLAIFAWGLCALGHLHLYGAAVAWAWPLACGGAGAPLAWSFARRLRRHTRRLARPRLTALGAGVLGFGALGLVLIYAGIMSAAVAGYDARWYHLALAEHYVAAGGITRFPEGFFGGAWPHLASWLYTWAFLAADTMGGGLFARIEQSLHVELAIFVATLAGLPVLVRSMLGGRRVPAAWVAVLLFPGIFLYDSSLNGTADHVLALWALALLIAGRRAWRAFEPRACLLFAVMAAAAASTKYQAVDVLAFPAAAFVAAAVGALARRRASPRRVVVAVMVAAAASVLLWSPHWLKNLVWYGDPLYPFLRGAFADRPWQPGALAGFAGETWRPSGPWLTELGRSLWVLLSFSFVPHDWSRFHGAVPVFGALFTLALPPMALLPGLRRAWPVAAAALGGVWIWYFTYHQDRYLQALVPWMAAVVAAVSVRAWETRDRVVRGGVALAIAAQVVWGADVPFLPTHAVLWRAPVQAAAELMSTGHRRDWAARTATASDLEPLGPLFPADARVLVHESEPRLGTGTQVVTDARGAQGGIDYAAWRSPARIARELRAMGVTHLVWQPRPERPREEQRLSNELAFSIFVARAAPDARPVGGTWAAAPLEEGALPEREPSIGLVRCSSGVRRAVAVSWDAVDRVIGEPVPTAAPPPAVPPDAWLLEEACPGAPPEGYLVTGRFAPFLIATSNAPAAGVAPQGPTGAKATTL
ncbi:MAG TPA: hypothetical protein VIU64_04820, partial [Polyangia bacterium]